MVRTRFAPSPTGYMHIGNLRTALYAFLYARRQGGAFILRIEDSDQKRNVPQAIRVIYESLKLANIDYDEGPDKDGGFGPYIQSQRREIYRQQAAVLLEKGFAYPCFCLHEDAAGKTAKDIERRDPCRYFSAEAAAAKQREGTPFVLRQKIPQTGTTSFVDHVFGLITVNNEELDDQVLLKSDGFPTYNFANVVDDHLMQITHVIRGVEYLSSTPKYNLLYEAFGWQIPEYVHLPHITKENGRKLSKREGDASFEDVVAKGYLPEAVVNGVALLGWNPGDDREFFTIEDLKREFDIGRINKSKAGFSFAKLDWINGQHLRAMSPEQFHEVAVKFYPSEVAARFDTPKISKIIHARVIRLTGIPDMIRFLTDLSDYGVELFEHEKSKSTLASSRMVLNEVQPLLAAMTEWSGAVLFETLKSLAEKRGLKTGTVMWPVRIAISGLLITPGGATEIAEIIGRQETLRRLELAQEKLATTGDEP